MGMFGALLIGMVALGTASASAQPSADLDRETALWQVAKDGRLDDLATLLDPDFVAVYAAGINDKAAELRALGEQKLESFKVADFTSRPVDTASVLVTYTVEAKGSWRGSDISGRYNVASLWKRAGDGWRLVYHSEVKAS